MGDHTMFKSNTPYMAPTPAKAEPAKLELGGEVSVTSVTKTVNPNRCGCCRKKLTLTDLECRCKVRFCAAHRMPEEHACSFDFKSHGVAALEKQLIRAVADKVERI